MGLLSIPYPDINPVAVQLGPFAVKWYGLAYMAGLLLGWLYIKRLLRQDRLWPGGKAPFSPDKTDDLLLYMTLGVLLGGRLGYVLFYEPRYFLSNPADIIAIWNGGMAFHGALIGSIVAIVLFARRVGALPWSVLDVCAAATPMGLFFGRLANFINAELWGRPSTVAWSMVFPGGGPVGGAFLAGYGLARSFCELFREPDPGHWLTMGPFTAGIMYSLPMIAIGVYMMWTAGQRSPVTSNASP